MYSGYWLAQIKVSPLYSYRAVFQAMFCANHCLKCEINTPAKLMQFAEACVNLSAGYTCAKHCKNAHKAQVGLEGDKGLIKFVFI